MSFVDALLSEFAVKVLATILAPILLALAYYLLREAFLALQSVGLVRRALKAVARRREKGLWVEGPGFWLKKPIVPPRNYLYRMQASIPILMIANLKGGVGKTTLSGSLAAHFAMRWRNAQQAPLRVLLVDLDFQGSLSTMTVADDQRFVQPSKANMLVSGDLGKGLLSKVAEPITSPGMRTPLSVATIPASMTSLRRRIAPSSNGCSRCLITTCLPNSSEYFGCFLQSRRVPRGTCDICLPRPS